MSNSAPTRMIRNPQGRMPRGVFDDLPEIVIPAPPRVPCGWEGCATLLSVHNPGSYCFLHARIKARNAKLNRQCKDCSKRLAETSTSARCYECNKLKALPNVEEGGHGE